MDVVCFVASVASQRAFSLAEFRLKEPYVNCVNKSPPLNSIFEIIKINNLDPVYLFMFPKEKVFTATKRNNILKTVEGFGGNTRV